MTIDNDQNQIERIVDLPAPLARVWRAIADYREFGAWFGVRLDNPFEVGTVTTGNVTLPGHESIKWASLTEHMEHERRFAFSWHPGDVDPDSEYDRDAKVRVEFRLEPTATGTRLTITETGFQQFPESKRLNILRSCAEGWNEQAGNIRAHLDHGKADARTQANAAEVGGDASPPSGGDAR